MHICEYEKLKVRNFNCFEVELWEASSRWMPQRKFRFLLIDIHVLLDDNFAVFLIRCLEDFRIYLWLWFRLCRLVMGSFANEVSFLIMKLRPEPSIFIKIRERFFFAPSGSLLFASRSQINFYRLHRTNYLIINV